MAARLISDCYCCVLLLLALIVASSSNQECDAWASLAKSLTGQGRTQVCDNKHTSKCTRFDCEGTFRAHPEPNHTPIVLDYCFGSQLNACSTPMSMYFYLALPGKNFSHIFTVEHDDKVALTELKIPFGNMGQVFPVFIFGLGKRPNGFIAFSVTMKLQLKFKLGGIEEYVPRLEQTLINTTTIPAENCSKSPNTTGPFKIGACHTQKYPSTNELTKTPTVVPSITPSDTLNKTCHFVTKPCSHGEICDSTLKTPTCKCGSDFHLSPKKDVCISFSKVGQTCESKFDCGYNEKCEGKDSKGFTCQCSKGYQYDKEREFCINTRQVIAPSTSVTTPDGGDTQPRQHIVQKE